MDDLAGAGPLSTHGSWSCPGQYRKENSRGESKTDRKCLIIFRPYFEIMRRMNIQEVSSLEVPVTGSVPSRRSGV